MAEQKNTPPGIFQTKITFRNFRSVGPQHPVTLNLCHGLTAIVGPNNSGKTNLLKWIVDLKNMIGSFVDTQAYIYEQGSSYGFDFPENEFAAYLSHGANGASYISFEIEHYEKLPVNVLQKLSIELTAKSGRSVERRFILEGGNSCVPVWLPGGSQRHANAVDENSNTTNLDTSLMRSLMIDLKNALYIPAFRHIVPGTTGMNCELYVGSDFVKQWSAWQAGSEPEIALRIMDVEKAIKSIYKLQELRIQPNHNKDDLMVIADSMQLPLRNIGSGMAEIIYILGNTAIRRPSYVFIDEPENHLHPAVQPLLIEALYRLSEKGVIMATHSLGLARVTANRVYAARKDSGGTRLDPIESLSSQTDYLGQMMLSGYAEYGYKGVLLCEGPSEVLVFKEFLRKLGMEAEIVLLPLSGATGINGKCMHILQEYMRLSKSIFAIVDSERKNEQDTPASNVVAFSEICKKCNIPCHILKYRAIENYFDQDALNAAGFGTKKALSHYEKISSLHWDKSENWKLAQATALSRCREFDFWGFVEKMREQVSGQV